MALAYNVPAYLQDLNQKGLIERAFHDGLYPNLAYRAEAQFEEWDANMGTEIFMTRPGLMTTSVTPLTPGSDPVVKTVPYEQWSATISQYAGTADVSMPTSVTAAADILLRTIHQLGLDAGLTVNRLARNAIFKAYCSGQTALSSAVASGDSTMRVASLNGFRDVIVPGGTSVRPQTVSSATPLPVRVGTGTGTLVSVIQAVPDSANDLDGPGTLVLSTTYGGSGATSRSAVRSAYAPRIVRSAAGNSVDSISATDILTLQQCINAVGFLRNANVQPHRDGFYHAHLSPIANTQLFADPVFQRLNTALPQGVQYKEGFVGSISGILFFSNTDSPGISNTGTRTLTGTNARYSSDIAAETTNDSSVDIGRVLITGKGALYEKGLDEKQFVTEAGTTGRIGEFDVQNNGVSIPIERVRLILRAPVDRLQQNVSVSWSVTTSFPVPSDQTAPSGLERYKRSIVAEHAI